MKALLTTMKALLTSIVLAMIPMGSLSGGEHFACDMRAMTKAERAVHQRLGRSLRESVEEQRELPNGYAFRMPPGSLVNTAKWVSLERKCCPFFTFGLEVTRDGGPLWLRITGSEGIKEFIRAEFGLDS